MLPVWQRRDTCRYQSLPGLSSGGSVWLTRSQKKSVLQKPASGAGQGIVFLNSQENCSVRSVDISDLIKNSFRSDTVFVETESRVRVSDM